LKLNIEKVRNFWSLSKKICFCFILW